jgi:predicted permease
MRAFSNFQLVASDIIGRDVVGAVRFLKRSPLFTLVVVVTLALAIGANAAILSFINVLVLKKLPVPNPSSLMLISFTTNGKGPYNGYSYPFYRDMAAGNEAFQGIAARSSISLQVSGEPAIGTVNAEIVSGNYFTVLDVRPAVGRLLDLQSGPNHCVISNRLWKEFFGSDPQVLARTIQLNHHTFEIVGVSQPGFSGSVLGQGYDVQIPISAAPLFDISLERAVWLNLMGRLRSGVSISQANTVIQSRGLQIDTYDPHWSKSRREFLLEDGSRGFSNLTKQFRSPAVILLGAAGLILLIGCANIAGLLSARGITRRHEIAIRLALGATRSRLIRQFLVESTALALLGACGGLVFAQWTTVLLTNLLYDGKQTSRLEAGFEPLLLFATIAIALIASVLFGLLPAWQTSQIDPLYQLKGERSAVGTARFSISTRRLLVVVQVAFALVLVAGAAVLAQTLRNLQTVDLGFRPEQVVLLTIEPQATGASRAATTAFFLRLLHETRRLAEVEESSLSAVSLLSGSMIVITVSVPGYTGRDNAATHYENIISPRYFKTIGTSIVLGRDFDDGDREGSPHVAIVNERFASMYWPGQNPIGKRIRAGSNRDIVGIVKNTNYQTVREHAPLTVYIPAWQLTSADPPLTHITLEARVRGSAERGLALLQHQVQALDPNVSLRNVRTLVVQRDYGLSTERTLAFLSTVFAALATTICILGVAGLISFSVSSRTKEIGVRMVLGADRVSIAWMFLKETLLLVAAGVAFGIPLAWGALRVLKTIVFGMPAQDFATVTIVTLLIFCASIAAVLTPMARSTRVDPSTALRQQ